MTVTRNDRNRTYLDGVLVEDTPVVVDVTAEVVDADLRSKAAAALTANATFMANGSPTNPQVLTQVRLLTRQINALIRLTVGLLDDTAQDT